MKEFNIMDDGVRLYAKMEYPEKENKKEIAIVVHGLADTMEVHPIASAAKAFRECGMPSLRVDMQGHGNSYGLFAKHTLFKWISNICAVIDKAKKEGYSDIYLCGHSQGGLVAMFAGRMRIDDVKALVLLSPAVNICEGIKKGVFLNYSFDPLHIPEKLMVFGQWLDGDYFRVAQLLSPKDAAACFDKDVLIITAQNDELVPLEDLEMLHAQYPSSAFTVLEGNHCFDGHDEELAKEICGYVARLQGKR